MNRRNLANGILKACLVTIFLAFMATCCATSKTKIKYNEPKFKHAGLLSGGRNQS